MAGQRLEDVRMTHPQHHRSIPAAGLAQDRPASVRPVPGVDVRDQLLDDMVLVSSGGRGVEILGAAQPGEAVRHDDDGLPHLLRADQPIQPLRQRFAPRLTLDHQLPEAGEPRQHEVDRVAPLWIRRGEIDGGAPQGRIAERIAPKDPAFELEDLDRHFRLRASSRSWVISSIA